MSPARVQEGDGEGGGNDIREERPLTILDQGQRCPHLGKGALWRGVPPFCRPLLQPIPYAADSGAAGHTDCNRHGESIDGELALEDVPDAFKAVGAGFSRRQEGEEGRTEGEGERKGICSEPDLEGVVVRESVEEVRKVVRGMMDSRPEVHRLHGGVSGGVARCR